MILLQGAEPFILYIISFNEKEFLFKFLKLEVWFCCILVKMRANKVLLCLHVLYIHPCINHMFGSCNQYTPTHTNTHTKTFHKLTHTNHTHTQTLHKLTHTNFYKHRLRKSCIPNLWFEYKENKQYKMEELILQIKY